MYLQEVAVDNGRKYTVDVEGDGVNLVGVTITDELTDTIINMSSSAGSIRILNNLTNGHTTCYVEITVEQGYISKEQYSEILDIVSREVEDLSYSTMVIVEEKQYQDTLEQQGYTRVYSMLATERGDLVIMTKVLDDEEQTSEFWQRKTVGRKVRNTRMSVSHN